MEEVKGNIAWFSKNVFLEKRVFLFCFGDKCMSGKISSIKKSKVPSEFDIRFNFIEPDFFRKELISGNTFTIREASRILGKGEIKEIIKC